MKAIYHGIEVTVDGFKANECHIVNEDHDFSLWVNTDDVLIK